MRQSLIGGRPGSVSWFKGMLAAGCGAAMLALGGCGLSQITSGLGTGIFGSSEKPSPEVADITEDQLLSAAKLDAPGGAMTSPQAMVGCPAFDVWLQDRHLTRYEAGREGDGLAIIHRGEITRTARECALQPGMISVKYGFSGRVLLGPRGQPGPVTLPVTVYVLDAGRNRISSENLVVNLEIEAGKPIGFFSAVRSVAFTIPEGARPADYRIYVAFEQVGRS
ncbi:MAG: hypothetical protein GC150_01505 [Rhizobiales bacterium]|nr:hypothetical protein [Hyphomicrobiales bacterium]